MKLNNKLLAAAKGISVWWGIYLILGCCAGFAVKTIQDLFMNGRFRIMLFIPFMCGGSLILAVITYFAAAMLKRAPIKKLRRKLVKVFKEEGFSQNYINMLFENAKGDNKNLMFIEAAAAYCLRGETETAEKTLAQADLTSIIDIAQSTGDHSTAAYYYCVKMAACIIAKNAGGAAEAYNDGSYYLDALADSDMVMAVLALYQTEGGLHSSAIDTLKKIKWSSLPRPMKKYGKAISEAVRAKNLLGLEKYPEAAAAARASLEAPCTEYMETASRELLRLAEEPRDTEEAAETEETSVTEGTSVREEN